MKAAAYYHVFKDANGNPLDGSNPRGYVLTFPPERSFPRQCASGP